MTTIHLVYPHGPRISTPDAIGRNLSERLRAQYKYQVALYDWKSAITIHPDPGDVLLGHPHPLSKTCFRLSMRQGGWRRILALGPYHHGDCMQVAFYDSFIARCDLFLAITGNYWFNTIEKSVFAHWKPKMIHLDLAVDRMDFPVIKTRFSPPGQRRLVYIGHSRWTKNTPFLSQIAKRLPDFQFSWIGRGRHTIAGLIPYGFQNFADESARQLLDSHDFMITVGKADANPTTILEAMAWGLIPVCTPQSGYVNYEGIINIPLNLDEAVKKLREIQVMPEEQLKSMQAANWNLLDSYFHWDRFARQVAEAIESDASPALERETFRHWLKIRGAFLVSPYTYQGISDLLRRLVRSFVRRIRSL
jgi:glycosyltransferase involved in cell wall biosynthesis